VRAAAEGKGQLRHEYAYKLFGAYGLHRKDEYPWTGGERRTHTRPANRTARVSAKEARDKGQTFVFTRGKGKKKSWAT